jgi:hypothetical protein
MPVPEPPYDGAYHSRVGFWELKLLEDEDVRWQLDIDAFVTNIRNQMHVVEEKITRELVVDKLRELGYTVTEPEEES